MHRRAAYLPSRRISPPPRHTDTPHPLSSLAVCLLTIVPACLGWGYELGQLLQQSHFEQAEALRDHLPSSMQQRLQPYAAETATLCSRGCNPMQQRLQPYAVEAAPAVAPRAGGVVRLFLPRGSRRLHLGLSRRGGRAADISIQAALHGRSAGDIRSQSVEDGR